MVRKLREIEKGRDLEREKSIIRYIKTENGA